MSRLVLINGAPGSGKSTVAQMLAQDRPLTLALDVDVIKHSLGGWKADAAASGTQARRLSLAMAGEHLRCGFDVIVGQYLVETAFIEELEQLAQEHGAQFHEYVLDLDAPALAERLAARALNPNRREHEVNNTLVGPADANRLVRSLGSLRDSRPHATWVDARCESASTVESLRSLLDPPE